MTDQAIALLAHMLAVVARNTFPLTAVLLVTSFIGGGRTARRRWAARIAIVSVAAGVFFGAPPLSAWLLYRVGQTASGKVISTYDTHNEVNDREVMGYEILLRTASGAILQTHLEDDELDAYPLAAYAIPTPDEAFNVRVLPDFPRDFVLLTDDDSPWAQRQRCGPLSLRMTDARQRFDFAGGAAPYRQPYLDGIDAYLRQGCAGQAEGVASYRQDRARAAAGLTDPAH